MAGEIVASNDHLLDRATTLRTLFSSNCSLRLFAGDFQPTPATKIGQFTECGFPGYARKNMATEWRPVFKNQDGEYTFQSNDQTFTPTGPSTEQCFGWFLCVGSTVRFSCRLPFPVTMTLNSPLTVRVDVQVWALSIL